MALIVEDGTGIVSANTYADLVAVRLYASDRGLVVPVADLDLEALIHTSMDKLESYENVMRGTRVDITTPQALSYPRYDLTASVGLIILDNGISIASDAIPGALIAALSQLVVDSYTLTQAGNVVDGMTTGQALTSAGAGPAKVTFASPLEGGATGENVHLVKFESLLAPLLNLAHAGGLQVLRV